MSTLLNTSERYGAVTKVFHWLTALLILVLIPLGIIAENLAHAIETGARAADQALVSRTALLFSLHKTLGVTLFFVALLRILWALLQRRPALLNGDKPLEAFAAQSVHWVLYGSLLIMPLSGWVHHAATTGFAPIWWPFGQSLPFVPKDEIWSETASAVHWLMQWVLIGALVLHVLGAMKHHLVDKDATLRRMLPGHTTAAGPTRQPGHVLPLVAALAIFGAALGSGVAIGAFPQVTAPERAPVSLTETEGNWQVTEGDLEITVVQMGSQITGAFAEWGAEILYSEEPDETGKHGEVVVQINTGSLSLGSVTSQATGPGYLASETHPVAVFDADILSMNNGLIAKGDLMIRDIAVPVEMAVEISIEGDIAFANGALRVDRRDFEMGQDVTDEGSLGFGVDIGFDLVAQRRQSE